MEGGVSNHLTGMMEMVGSMTYWIRELPHQQVGQERIMDAYGRHKGALKGAPVGRR